MRDHAKRGVASHLDVGGYQIPMNDPSSCVRRFERLRYTSPIPPAPICVVS
jgi:hypothetical protein